MALATLALSAWLVRNTLLEPEQSAEVAEAVLDSPTLRNEIASQVSTRISEVTGQPAFQIEANVEVLLEDPAVAESLATTITAAHARLIDPDAPPVIVDTSAMSTLSGGVVAEQYELAVPTISALDTLSRIIDVWLPLVAAVAVAMAALAMVLHPNPARALCQIGYWLVAASLLQVLVGWFVPVVVIPAFTDSPWADVVAAAVRAYNDTLLTTLAAVLGGGGAALVLGAWWGLAARRDYDA